MCAQRRRKDKIRCNPEEQSVRKPSCNKTRQDRVEEKIDRDLARFVPCQRSAWMDVRRRPAQITAEA
jgi:hypothetical protein